MKLSALVLAAVALAGTALASINVEISGSDLAGANKKKPLGTFTANVAGIDNRADRKPPPKSQYDSRCHTPFWKCVDDCKNHNLTDCERVCNCMMFIDKKFLCITPGKFLLMPPDLWPSLTNAGCTKFPEGCTKDKTKPQEKHKIMPTWASEGNFGTAADVDANLHLDIRQSHLECSSCDAQTQQCQYLCKGDKICEDVCVCQTQCPARCFHCGKCDKSCPRSPDDVRDNKVPPVNETKLSTTLSTASVPLNTDISSAGKNLPALPPPWTCANCDMAINACKTRCDMPGLCNDACVCHIKMNVPLCRSNCRLKCNLGKRGASIPGLLRRSEGQVQDRPDANDVQTGIGVPINLNAQCTVAIDHCKDKCAGVPTCNDACNCWYYKSPMCKEAKIKCHWPYDGTPP